MQAFCRAREWANRDGGMTAREIDNAAERLDHLRHHRRSRLVMSMAAVGLAAVALIVSNALAISMVLGVASLLLLALGDTVRRRDLIARLALNEHAYAVPEVRRYGAALVMLRGRRRVAASLERVLADAGAPGTYYLAKRVHDNRREIRALAKALRAPGTEAEPTSIALCWRLLRSGAESPLYNWHLPAEDLGIAVRRIRAGVRPPHPAGHA
jgi:hypothetical protein